MNDIIYNYIIQAILGGASGYITNEYAINMLFKEYTPLKIGGVIKKTRNEFIDNLSSLVENDIINKDKLNNILIDESFKSKFESLTEDFFNNCLYNSADSANFSDIDEFESSVKQSGDFFKKIIDNNSVEMTNLLFNNIKIDDFLTDKQLEKISSSLYDSINDLINDSNVVRDISLSLYNEYKNNKLISLLDGTEKIGFNITENFIHKLNQVITDNFNDRLNNAVKDIYLSLELNETLLSIKEKMYEKPFKDIITIDEDLKINIVKLFSEYIYSENGQDSILQLCNSIFSYVKKYDKTLFNLFDSSFEINLKSYLLDNLPSLTENIIGWIYSNSKNIDKIIEESVDEVIDEATGMKGKLLSTIKNSYLNNLSEKYNIVQKIIDYVKNETEPEQLSNNVSSKFINYLNTVSISEILTSAENSNIITPSIASKYLTEYLETNFESIFNEIINYVMNLKLKDVMPTEIYSATIIKENILELIMDKIISSESISDSLCQKIYANFNILFNKNLNELVDEESIYNNNSNIKGFIYNVFNNNSEYIKNSIKVTIKNNLNISKFQSSRVYSDIPNGISKEILKKYNEMTNGTENKKLSLAIDKINSIENLYKNSSELLRSLMINNLDTLLGDSVKKLVTENLNKLNDDELSNLANDFIGRELKPIMFFGGILGTGAGITLAIFQNSPISLDTINIANMITYSLVGFSTNAIAINMIFRPYKEIKLLSKIPFLRNFSLGYIVKNKKIFAENMSVFIDKNLLSKESINELFGKYEDNLNTKLLRSIESNNYILLNNLLKNNQENIVAGTYTFTKNLLAKNTNNLSNFAVNNLDNFGLSSLLSPENTMYLSAFAKEKIYNSKDELINFIENKINSTSKLETQIPNSFVNIIKNYVATLIKNYYDITNNNLNDSNNIKKFMMKYNKKYTRTINKPLKEIFKSINIEAVNSFVSYRLYKIISSKHSRKKISDTISNLFNKSVGGNKTFGELFDGKMKNYINNNTPTLINKITHNVKSSIAQSKGAISSNVQNEIKGSLGFLEKGMYSLMGGDAIVSELIEKIIVDKIPCFIDDKEQELLDIFNNIIEEKFYKVKVDSLQSSINKIQVDEMVNTYLSNDENAELIKEKIANTISLTQSKLEKFNLNDILKLLSLESMNNIFNTYSNEINILITDLSKNMTTNKKDIINIIIPLINELTDEFIKAVSFKDLFSKISNKDTSLIIDNLMDTLNGNFLEKEIQNIISNYKQFIFNNDKISNFIDKEELVKSTEIFITDFISKNEFESFVKSIYSSTLKEAIDLNFNFIDEKTKSYMLNIFVKSAIESIKVNLDTILKAIEFDRIAREEIYDMEPKKIHEMFNSFADKYFRRLMVYGLGGFVFGINAYFGLVLSGFASINKFIHKSKD
ncbi:uncharacterized membrane protein YheB (UPF0754 family) [Sedimentibacter acidaminivorans]|uniref:Uncharacterized membrane protein YheB (UPF0754 family) n=1 Tax=Sedimentibacter acidaminivorans TaxID=913099 RepID=A0ABS4GAG5_9FIRM|nr:DUF445 family protein [Sedimentibacter acidaminivorans]MBP1924679.1 uncharacterized membrane protein YheB (UPF0754 family) [Sedimentibacter acidaminivorans]